MLSAMKFEIILWGMAQLLKYAAWRYPAFRARLKERNLVAQLKARDEEIGRWYAIRDGKVTSGRGLRTDADVTLRVQDRGARRQSAHAADQLARPDQRAEGFQAHGRRTGGPHQLVRADHHDEPERRPQDRHAARRRHHALLQHDQRRAGLRLCQGRQDRPHDADRSRRQRRRVLDHPRARARSSRRRARRRLRRTARMPSRSSIRPTGCSIR